MRRGAQGRAGAFLRNCLGKLIEALMRIAVQHAGAERGLLILLRGGTRIEAEAATAGGRVEVRCATVS